MGHVVAAPGERLPFTLAVGLDAFGEITDVGAGAKRASLAGEDDSPDAVVGVPGRKLVHDLAGHRVRPRVELAWAVEADDAHPPLGFSQNLFVCHVASFFTVAALLLRFDGSLDRALVSQGGQFVGVDANLAQDLLGVLAEGRRLGTGGQRRGTHADRRADDPLRLPGLVGHLG